VRTCRAPHRFSYPPVFITAVYCLCEVSRSSRDQSDNDLLPVWLDGYRCRQQDADADADEFGGEGPPELGIDVASQIDVASESTPINSVALIKTLFFTISIKQLRFVF
jgi:hypothetical protein